ncbi:hypothetical protein I316_00679 [Kwoniella heveanensis BCC8398]|uniref:Histone demethylase JARID1 n=1 Tax=Kwoniella heveanensis BCC8398 TaxID=1296120 RepID=A0A1B9H2Q4_9TREE|nr:hypothetical protein I316_00679 [Kwoniella heveanensis BCC8398]
MIQPQTPPLGVTSAGVNVSASAGASTAKPLSYPTRQRMASSSSAKPPRTPNMSNGPNGAAHSNTSPTKRSSPSESKRKPTFTSSLQYPDVLPAPTYFSAGTGEGGELQRSQRRSKAEANAKLDRGGTPIQVNTGPTATSFLPPSAQPQQPIAGPSAARNPLHRPTVINPPFSPSTVRQEAPRYPTSRTATRPFGLEECPVFYPTAEEFKDTMAYISSITEEARPYGICKIVPPEGWKMPFTLESETFRFKTRLQRLNQLEAASRAKINFLEQLSMFHNQSSENEISIPRIDRQPLDVWKLRKEVNKAGGYLELDRTKAWGKITETLGHKPIWGPHVREAYMSIVLPFDRWALRAKSASVSPLTPMQAPNGTRPPAFTTDTPPSPSQIKSAGRMGSVKVSPRTRMSSRMGAQTASLPANAAPFSSVNGLQAAAEIEQATLVNGDPSTTVKIKVPGFSTRDGSESELSDADSVLSDGSPRKPQVATPEYQKGEVCEVCRGGHAADKILLCDGCDRGFHTYCLDPPLASVPTNEEWFCTSCLLSQGDDFGFDEGEDHSMASFQARDASFSYHWWNRHRPQATSSSAPPSSNGLIKDIKPNNPLARNFGKVSVTEDDVEREFWRLTESATDTVEVEYGADVHSTTHGSAGPTMETHPLDPYAADGWNLNNMPILPDSLLRYIRSDISGMTVPWIYLGMMFSTFCWHNEDHYTYSVNYMYWGETKTWYGIPGSDAEKFEEAMKSEAPELFEQQPGLLFQLVTMMNPGRVRDAGVKVVACDQRPNEFVITFPKAYHCGFNHGINMNEAVNFALPDWLAEGKESVVKYQGYLKPPVFDHNELLITITLYSETIRTAIWLRDSLEEMVEEETRRRDHLRALYPNLNETIVEDDGPEDQYQCAVCKAFCYLAQITCSCTKLVTCLDHAEQLCSCSKSKRTLRKRYTEAQLDEILAIVVARASQPENWRNKLYSLLEVPRPALKSMRTLLAEGEKIAYSMPETYDLRALVDRAYSWVDRVSALLTRKTAGRRRKGKKDEEEDEDMVGRSPEVLSALLKEGETLAFDAPEILQLRQSLLSIQSFQSEASVILSTPEDQLDLEKCKTVLILGESLNLDLPEIAAISTIINRLTWFRKVEDEVDDRTLEYKDTVKLLQQAEEFDIPETHPTIVELKRRRQKGADWLEKVEELFISPTIQIDQISTLIEGQELVPVAVDKMRQLENMRKTVLGWQSSARNFLSSNGSALAASRLCKNVSSASAPINRVEIPEIIELQEELDHHALWQEKVAEILEVPINQVTHTVKFLLREFEHHFNPEDDEPSDDIVCFCRNPPGAVMVTCRNCQGEYHPRCVGVTPKNASNPFQCAMCLRILPGDGPSLNEFAALATSERWNFKITPPDFVMAKSLVDAAVRYSVVMLKMIDARDEAEPYRDVDKIQHAIRKIYSLSLLYDAYNFKTNERVVFVKWLFKRMQDAIKFHAGLLKDGVAPPKERTRTRGRKPRFVLAQAYPKELHCICPAGQRTPDYNVLVDCMKCGQVYHASCVRAPPECIGTDGKGWRCPCCAVKEAKYYQKGVEVRVQMKEQFGTNEYIDYRSTINEYAETPIMVHWPPSSDVILLECTKFVPPILPEDIGRDASAFEGQGGDASKKRRKVRPSDVATSDINGHTASVHGDLYRSTNGPVNGGSSGHATPTSATPTQANFTDARVNGKAGPSSSHHTIYNPQPIDPFPPALTTVDLPAYANGDTQTHTHAYSHSPLPVHPTPNLHLAPSALGIHATGEDTYNIRSSSVYVHNSPPVASVNSATPLLSRQPPPHVLPTATTTEELVSILTRSVEPAEDSNQPPAASTTPSIIEYHSPLPGTAALPTTAGAEDVPDPDIADVVSSKSERKLSASPPGRKRKSRSFETEGAIDLSADPGPGSAFSALNAGSASGAGTVGSESNGYEGDVRLQRGDGGVRMERSGTGGSKGSSVDDPIEID